MLIRGGESRVLKCNECGLNYEGESCPVEALVAEIDEIEDWKSTIYDEAGDFYTKLSKENQVTFFNKVNDALTNLQALNSEQKAFLSNDDLLNNDNTFKYPNSMILLHGYHRQIVEAGDMDLILPNNVQWTMGEHMAYAEARIKGYNYEDTPEIDVEVESNSKLIMGHYQPKDLWLSAIDIVPHETDRNDWFNVGFNALFFLNYNVYFENTEAEKYVTTKMSFTNDERYVKLQYTVKCPEGESPIEEGGLSVTAPIQIGTDKISGVSDIKDSKGNNIGLKTVGRATGLDPAPQLNIYYQGTSGAQESSPRIWTGSEWVKNDAWYDKDLESWPDLPDLPEKDQWGIAITWDNINLKPGESKTYSILVGLGEESESPQWDSEKPIDLTWDKSNGKEVANDAKGTVTASIKEANAGTVNTLYATIDGALEQIIGTDKDSSGKITGELDLSKLDLKSGEHKIQFWLMNDKGAMSEVSEAQMITVKDSITEPTPTPDPTPTPTPEPTPTPTPEPTPDPTPDPEIKPIPDSKPTTQTKPETVKTGDYSQSMQWFVLSGLSIVGILWCVFKAKKKNKKVNEL